MGLDIVEVAPGIRRLGDAALQASIDRALAMLPADHKGATVDIGVDPRGIQAVAIVRLSAAWSVQGLLDQRFHGEWSGHVQVRWSGR